MLVDFATSDAGKIYGRTCERYGVDPGAVLDDDVLALNLRVALVLSDIDEDEPDEFEQAKQKSQEAFA
jgi:hypothetical protein